MVSAHCSIFMDSTGDVDDEDRHILSMSLKTSSALCCILGCFLMGLSVRLKGSIAAVGVVVALLML
jgi:hypothetical protein